MAKSSKRSNSNMRRKLSTKELNSVVKQAKRKMASNKRKRSRSKKSKRSKKGSKGSKRKRRVSVGGKRRKSSKGKGSKKRKGSKKKRRVSVGGKRRKSSKKKSTKKRKSRGLMGGFGYSVDVSQNIGGLSVIKKNDGCKTSTTNNFDMPN